MSSSSSSSSSVPFIPNIPVPWPPYVPLPPEDEPCGCEPCKSGEGGSSSGPENGGGAKLPPVDDVVSGSGGVRLYDGKIVLGSPVALTSRGFKSGAWSTTCTLTWDAWNRLITCTDGTTTTTNRYDALARRIRKSITGGEVRDYYYDKQWRSIEERLSGTFSGPDKTRHLWSPFDRWALIRRQRETSGTLTDTHFCLKDYLDPTALITPAAAVVERFSYDAFGLLRFMNAAFITQSSSSYTWTFLFHGEFTDSESGLYNYGYRFYNPSLGRWLSRDPIGEDGGVNLQLFVDNGPQNQIDALGLEPQIIRAAGGSYLAPGNIPGFPRDTPNYDFVKKNGCVGLALILQGYRRRDADKPQPEDQPGVECFNTEKEAKAVKCPDKKIPFIFAVQGTPRKSSSTGKETGKVDNHSITVNDPQKMFNYCSLVNGWYYWTETAGSDIKRAKKPPENPSLSRTIYCVDCKCPGSSKAKPQRDIP